MMPSVATLFIHRCQVLRRAVIGSGGYGQDKYGDYQPDAALVACFWSTPIGPGSVFAAGGDVVLQEHHFLVAMSENIDETCQIAGVFDRLGNALDTHTMRIREVRPRHSYKIVICQEAR